jgi:2-keto-4-pentenoate hydratase
MNTQRAAERLMLAAASRVPCAPVRDLIGTTDIDAAYAVQQQLTRARLAGGARIVGRKIGLTSIAVQEQLGVDQPDFGVLFDDMDMSGRAVPMSRLLQPKAEAEIAFVLGDDLTIASAHVALEIVDSRIADWDISCADTIADNASSGLFVLGDPIDVEPRLAEMAMRVNGEVVSKGTGEDCIGDPLAALRWLADTAEAFGAPLLPGQVVLSGALGPMVAVVAGDVVETTISGVSLTVRFEEA